MITNDLKGKRILVTQANTFMGPKLCEVFAEMGAEVITDNQLLTDPALPGEIIAAAGTRDVLVINLASFTTYFRVTDRIRPLHPKRFDFDLVHQIKIKTPRLSSPPVLVLNLSKEDR